MTGSIGWFIFMNKVNGTVVITFFLDYFQLVTGTLSTLITMYSNWGLLK